MSAVVVIVPRRRRNVNATEDTNFIGFNDSFVRVSTFHRLPTGAFDSVSDAPAYPGRDE